MAIDYSPGEPNSSRKANAGRAATELTRPQSLGRHSAQMRVLRRLGLGAGIIGCGLLAYAAFMLYSLERRLPDISGLGSWETKPPTTIVSSDGVVLATIRTQDRQPINLAAVSPYVLKATIAIEDSRFYRHHGVDARGVVRALWSNLRDGNARGQGGSTLTQQLARNLYLSNRKTFSRKLEEMLLAARIEKRYTKAQILEAYLNTVYYGNGCYGLEAAAQTYFGKTSNKLTLGEAALLAGLPQRPAAFAPFQHLTAALHRRDAVLARMVETGAITQEQAGAAWQEPLRLTHARPQGALAWKAPYFVSAVLEQLRARYGPDYAYTGIRVETTLNWKMQCAAESALRNGLRNSVANTGAIVMLEPHTGFVRALVGGPDFRRCQFDAVTQGSRQPGSAFKPLVYATAFDNRVCTLLSTYPDHELTYPDGGRAYVVHNYDLSYQGNMTVLDALRRSTNTVAVQVGAQTGFDRVVATARQLGITTPLVPGLPLALGDSAMRPIDLCSAYSAFANGGARYDPTLIARIVSASGEAVYADHAASRSHPAFLDPRTLDQINVALREVATTGTGAGAAAIPDAHGKTGTTSGHRDAWFVGYTGDLAAAVWVAREQQEPGPHVGAPHRLVRYMPMSDATGGSLCVPIWRDLMRQALQEQRRINRLQASDLRQVAAPPTYALLAILKAEALKQAGEARLIAARATNTEGTYPPGHGQPAFVPAQDGSGPIIVTAPPDTTPSQPDAGRSATGADPALAPSGSDSDAKNGEDKQEAHSDTF